VCIRVLRALPDGHIHVLRDELCELALSDLVSVRELARFVLRNSNPPDFAAICRARLESAGIVEPRPGWIATLGELGSPSDFERVAAWLDNPSSRIRAAALAAALRLDRARAEPAFVKALEDPRRAVRHVVWRCLPVMPRELWLAWAEDLVRKNHASLQRRALHALTSTGDWTVVPALLEGLLAPHESARLLARQGIDTWLLRHKPRSWLRPSDDVKRRLEMLWPITRERCDASTDFMERSCSGRFHETWIAFRSLLDCECGPPKV